MKVSWLIEKDVFEDNEKQLYDEIQKQGMDVKFLEYDHLKPSMIDEMVNNPYEWDPQCVVFYGSLELGRKIKKTPWVPGVYLNDKALECSSYYPILGDMLVHNHYTMLPYGDLLRLKDWLFDCAFLHADKLFIRPNSGNKQFTGMILEKDKWEEGIKLAGFYGINPNMIILISTVWALTKEWRFVVVDGKVISGSLYRDWSQKGEESTDYVLKHSIYVKEECKDKRAWDIAQKCADKYNPDHCWTIDVAEAYPGTFYVLEIGCFSCAGLYGNNLENVVKAVSAAALNEWNEYNDPNFTIL